MIEPTLEQLIDKTTKNLCDKIDKWCDKLAESRKSCDKAIESIEEEEKLLDKIEDLNK
jgi:hypothetical protein